jgi:hypothetical protein
VSGLATGPVYGMYDMNLEKLLRSPDSEPRIFIYIGNVALVTSY